MRKLGWVDVTENPGDDGESEKGDDEADDAINNSILGFLNLSSVTRGGGVLDARVDNEDDGDDADEAGGELEGGAKGDVDAGGGHIHGAGATTGEIEKVT